MIERANHPHDFRPESRERAPQAAPNPGAAPAAQRPRPEAAAPARIPVPERRPMRPSRAVAGEPGSGQL